MRIPLNDFPGFENPSISLKETRTQLRTLPLFVDIDLSVARSSAAGTAQNLPIAGNSFYADQVYTTGVATVHFQDLTLKASTPLGVIAGFIARVPFTQLAIENAAQPGKILRIIYGIDIDFTAANASTVSVAGNVAIINSIASTTFYAVDSFQTPLGGAAGVKEIFPAAINTKGILIKYSHIILSPTGDATLSKGALVAANTATLDLDFTTSGSMIVLNHMRTRGTTEVYNSLFDVSTMIPPGFAIYSIGSGNGAFFGVNIVNAFNYQIL